jgi:hypothetical protein
MMVCERCKHETYKTETCNYCGRKLDERCIKATQRATKTQRLVICKDDWGNLRKRKMYKNKQEMRLQQAAAQPKKA